MIPQRISNAILLCAGGRIHKKEYEINVKSAIVGKVTDMNANRSYAGVGKCKEYCFVFGGDSGSGYLACAEKYSLSAKIWTPLPHPMKRPKYFCSVCEHSSGLYIWYGG